MLFVLIIALFIAFSYEPPSDPVRMTGSATAAVGTALAIAGVWLLAELFAWVTTWRLKRAFHNRGAIMRGYQRLRWLHTIVLIAGYAGVIHGLDWPAVVRIGWGLDQWILVDDVLVLFPFVAALVLSWLAHFRVEECVRRQLGTDVPQWRSRWSHLDFLLRQQFGVVLAPLVLLVVMDDLVGLIFRDSEHRQTVQVVTEVATFAGMIVLAPYFLRLLWRAQPLPAGPLRDRLERLGRRLRFRSSDILLWKTDGAVVNAAVAGMVPWLRYVFLSDGLVRHLTEDEIEAVFGHEVGHIRHHHLWFFLAFLLGSSLVLLVATTTTYRLLADLLGAPTVQSAMSLAHGLAAPLSAMAVYFGVFFGFLSRRFERQADIFGCRAVSCGHSECPDLHVRDESVPGRWTLCPVGIHTFVAALEKVSMLNGSTRDTRSWRHFSIAKRVEFLERLAARPDLERRFQRIVWALKTLVIAALVGSGWWLWCHARELAGAFFEIGLKS
ncbi:MAG: M48 family metalloprotease [Planctomycetes bacterium]|nr:M48 family metalloprotease [Planctomycetota bacterium]